MGYLFLFFPREETIVTYCLFMETENILFSI